MSIEIVDQMDEMAILSHVGPFSDELIFGDHKEAIQRLRSMEPLDAVRLVLAACRRNDAVVEMKDIDAFAEAIGVFGGDDDE